MVSVLRVAVTAAYLEDAKEPVLATRENANSSTERVVSRGEAVTDGGIDIYDFLGLAIRQRKPCLLRVARHSAWGWPQPGVPRPMPR